MAGVAVVRLKLSRKELCERSKLMKSTILGIFIGPSGAVQTVSDSRRPLF